MRKALAALVVAGLCAVGSTAASSAAVTTNTKAPLSGLAVYVPCANGGLGEWVSLEGSLHVLLTFTQNENGFSGKFHFQPQGVSGVGSATGDRYRGTGATQGTFVSHVGGGFTETDVNNFRIIGPGPRNNYLVHSVFHVTVHPDGVATAEVAHSTAECK
jgi:hypothetical protein